MLNKPPTPKFTFQGLPVTVSPHVPLTHTDEDGTEHSVCFVRIYDNILVHPDRWDEMLELKVADGG